MVQSSPIPDTILRMFKGLEHTAIASPDPRKLAQWYVDHLEFTINFEYAGNYFVKADNGSMLEIIPSEGDRAAQKMKDPGIRHLAILVDDFDAAHERLKAAGVVFLGEPISNQGNRLLFFADGDGNFLHLIHRQKAL
jgi:glyoxylase I family protein